MLIDHLPEFWRPETDHENIVWLYFDQADSSENRVSLAALRELDEILGEIRVEKPKGVVLLSDKPAGFSAGFDLDELATLDNDKSALAYYRLGYRVLDKLASLPMPTVAVLHGRTSLAGLELAMACDHLLALDGEVNNRELALGLLPGFGGLGRSFQRLGSKSLRVLLSNDPLPVPALAAWGLIDRLLENDEQVYLLARRIIARPPLAKAEPRWRRWQSGHWSRVLLAFFWRRKIRRVWPEQFYPAPHTAIKLWKKSAFFTQSWVSGEIRQAAHLLAGDTAQNLIHAAILRRDHIRAVEKSIARASPPQQIFIAGLDATHIALARRALAAGMRVSLHDADPRRLKRAEALIRKRLTAASGRVGEASPALSVDVEGQSLAAADLALATPEALRWPVFQKQKATRTPVLVSCALDCDVEAIQKRSRMAVFHATAMQANQPLLELTAARKTVAWNQPGKTAPGAKSFALNAGCLPVLVSTRGAAGFLVNHVMAAVIDEALIMVSEGAPERLVDQIATHHGMPVGPVAYARSLHPAELRAILPAPERAEVLARMRGFLPIWLLQKRVSRARREELFERLVLRLYNAAVETESSHRVKSWRELDVAMLASGLVADFTGGVLRAIERESAPVLRQRLLVLSEQLGERFSPSKNWGKL